MSPDDSPRSVDDLPQERSSLLSASASREPHDAAQRESRADNRLESLPSKLTLSGRVWLFSGIFLVGYAYGLESQVRSAYQPFATSSFKLHSYLSTINVLRSVVAVAVQPTAAKIADLFGRFEVILLSTMFYVLGMAVESTASSVYAFCAGAIIYQIGYTAIVLLLEVLVADFSSIRARVILSYIPALPFIINTWISGSMTSAVLSITTWRWGIGMWCFVYPICSLPLLLALRSVKHDPLIATNSIATWRRNTWSAFGYGNSTDRAEHPLDVLGLLFLVAGFSLILAPLSVIGSTVSHWRDPYVLTSLAVGIVCIPVFVVWERQGARVPLVPFHMLTDRGVWAALVVRSLLNTIWYVQGNYLFTVLIVAFDFSISTATRILNFFSFFGVISGVVVGYIVYRTRRLKAIIIGGTVLFSIALIILHGFPGDVSSRAKAGMISGQIIMGLASGLFAYPTQASVQASASPESVAIITGLYLSFYNVGSALGTCIAGVIWSQTLLPKLEDSLAFQANRTLAKDMYNSPFSVIAQYPVGTAERSAIIMSYASVQRLLCVVGLALCIPMILFAFALRNPRLSGDPVSDDTQQDRGVIIDRSHRRH